MKRILGLGLLLTILAMPLLAKTKNSHVLLMPSDVRVGDTQLPQGRYDVTWSEAKGSEVQLTIKTADKKTITVPARVAQKQREGFQCGNVRCEWSEVRYGIPHPNHQIRR